MNHPLISVIVPVYNAAGSIRICIESILNQSYTNFELILIDDGSMDSSLSICEEYMIDKRVVVVHQANGGVSAARNKGLSLAKGDYVTFVDADDKVKAGYLQSFIASNDMDVDLIVGGYVCHEGMKHMVVTIENGSYIQKGDISSILEKLLGNIVLQVPWGKLFKRNILVSNKITFDVQMFFGEDTLFVQEYLLHIHSMKSIDQANYVYEREPKWQIKYGNKIALHRRAFDRLLASIDALSLVYADDFCYAKDWFVNIYSQIFQSYMFQTPLANIDKELVQSFFSNEQVDESIRRFKKYRKNLHIIDLLKKNMLLLILYSKIYGFIKWR